MKEKFSKVKVPLIFLTAILLILSVIFIALKRNESISIIEQMKGIKENRQSRYPMHKSIATTVFWVGEQASADNQDISNIASVWDERWAEHFGGIDDPKNRNGYFVADFQPMENSFYYALPYNDFNKNGKRKKYASSLVPWAGTKLWDDNESMLKNQWIKITKGTKTAYAQWEDVGPFGEDDSEYVFGSAEPLNEINHNAGLDISPAVRDYLGLTGSGKTDWQFVDSSDVPDGPWKKTITTSQITKDPADE